MERSFSVWLARHSKPFDHRIPMSVRTRDGTSLRSESPSGETGNPKTEAMCTVSRARNSANPQRHRDWTAAHAFR
jgi:hypothetical protein